MPIINNRAGYIYNILIRHMHSISFIDFDKKEFKLSIKILWYAKLVTMLLGGKCVIIILGLNLGISFAYLFHIKINKR